MLRTRLLLVACLLVRAASQDVCTYASSGFLAGAPFHLAVTYLTPGLPDWRIAVPLPPPECAHGYVAGEETLVCDFDVPPSARIAENGGILVHRNGLQQGYATVNVTVFCILPSAMSVVPASLVLALALVAADESRVLRERQQRVCSSAHFGSSSGAAAQRLVVTHLTPGVADWNIAVPMPPKCKNARVTGVETSVCDADEPPDVSMPDLVSARVHRRGQLSSYATVDVTVYCVLPPSTPSPATTASSPLGAYGAAGAPGLQYGDARSSYEVLSNELISNEVVSGEVASGEVAPDGYTSNELVLKVVTPIPSVATVPPVETSTPHIQLTSLVQSVEPPVPKESPPSNDMHPQSYDITIKIRPPSYDPNDKGKSLTYEARLPILPLENEKHVIEVDSVPEIPTPPRNSGIMSQPPATGGTTSGALGPQPGSSQTGMYMPPHGWHGHPPGGSSLQPGMFLPPRGHPVRPLGLQVPSRPESLMLAPQFSSLYDALPPTIVVAPFLRPVRLLSSRFGLWPRQRSVIVFPRL